MATKAPIELGAAWTLVSSAPCLLENRSINPVEFAFSTLEPGSTIKGHLLYQGDTHTSYASGVNIWARGFDGKTALLVVSE